MAAALRWASAAGRLPSRAVSPPRPRRHRALDDNTAIPNTTLVMSQDRVPGPAENRTKLRASECAFVASGNEGSRNGIAMNAWKQCGLERGVVRLALAEHSPIEREKPGSTSPPLRLWPFRSKTDFHSRGDLRQRPSHT